MNAKEYLNRAYKIDKQITSKLEQIQLLIPTPSCPISQDTAVQSSMNYHSFEDKILKHIEEKERLEKEIETLLETKREVAETINKLNNLDQRLILEYRFLCFNSWDDIAVKLDFSKSHMFRIYEKALQSVEKILEVQTWHTSKKIS